jgi:hypothetical protein
VIAKQFPDSHKDRDSLILHPLWRAPFGANYHLRTILLLLDSDLRRGSSAGPARMSPIFCLCVVLVAAGRWPFDCR